jgi:hypothetical protein
METAITIDNRKILATPRVIAFCESCGARVVPKCGPIKINHFAHYKGSDCDKWNEPETDWHREWKSHVPIDQREVVLVHNNKRHRADIYLPLQKTTVEFQHSTIEYNQRVERNQFYKKIIWVAHINQIRNHETFAPDIFTIGCDTGYLTNPYSWVLADPFDHPLFIDFCNGLMIHVKTKSSFKNNHMLIQGKVITKDWFIKNVLNNSHLDYNSLTPEYEKTISELFLILDIIEYQFLDIPTAVFTSGSNHYVLVCPHCKCLKKQSGDNFEKVTVDKEYFRCKRCKNYFTIYLIPMRG